MKSKILFGAALAGATITLAACSAAQEETVQEDPDGIVGMEIKNARLVLAPVSGNPAAVYFDATYNGDRAFNISRADVQGAESAMIHEYAEWAHELRMQESGPVPITKGETVKFEPGGRHIMAMNVSPELQAGGKTTVTIIISGGDKHSFEADILAAGDDRSAGGDES